MSRVIAILLMLLMPLQAFAAVERQLAHPAGSVLEHMLEHAEHVPHHHDDDGDIEFDDSAASASHQLDFDYGMNFQAALTVPVLPPLLPHTQSEPLFLGGAIPHPDGSPPLRPPHAPA
ncbi:hypothetical protein [Cupriavidus oxalaticus]|uniref:hypothetical protein n=1 Tax=Cupriavidus oxalaticus TaxID=96344 RepID=UPI00317CABC4